LPPNHWKLSDLEYYIELADNNGRKLIGHLLLSRLEKKEKKEEKEVKKKKDKKQDKDNNNKEKKTKPNKNVRQSAKPLFLSPHPDGMLPLSQSYAMNCEVELIIVAHHCYIIGCHVRKPLNLLISINWNHRYHLTVVMLRLKLETRLAKFLLY